MKQCNNASILLLFKFTANAGMTTLLEQSFSRWFDSGKSKVNRSLSPVMRLVFESLEYPAQSCYSNCLPHSKGSILKKGSRCHFFYRVDHEIITAVYIIFYRVRILRCSTF